MRIENHVSARAGHSPGAPSPYRRPHGWIAALAILALVSAVSGTPAQAETTSEAKQQPYDSPIGQDAPASAQHASAVDDLHAVEPADRLPIVADTIYTLGAEEGFAGQVVSPESRSVTVYWKGPLPAAVEEFRATAEGLGVHVTLATTEARYTRLEEQAAAERLSSSDLAAQAGITSVSARPQGTGITVQMAESEPDLATKNLIAQVAGIPDRDIAYEANVGSLVPLASRNNDAAPWKGGARTIHGGSACSSGFATLSGSSGRLISAAHCDPSGNLTVMDGGGTTIATGSGISLLSGIDSMSIDPSASPATTPTIYIGVWNSSATATVKNWATNWTGDYVCAGGATTGTHCGTITDDSVTYSGHTGSWYVRARASSGAFIGGGDSGGPVYRSVSGGVQARGIINAGYTATLTTCGAHNPDVDPPCYRDMLYTPISVVLNSWGYSLEVG